MSKHNKALFVRMTEEIWVKGNLDRMEEFYAPDVVIHNAPPDLPAGIAGVRKSVAMFRGALPDLKSSVQFVLGDGDMVANYWTMSGTHNGDLMGLPATGKQVKFDGMSLVRYEGGKIVEIWGASDQLGLMQQLGALLVPGQA